MKILITGGHLTPGLAVIDWANKHQKGDWYFVWAGRLYNQDKSQQKSNEKNALESRNIRFIEFKSGKSSDNKALLLFKLWGAYAAAKKIIKAEKPDLFLSFGGYLAVPMAAAAKYFNIPIITHEQTRVLGKANQIIASQADILALAYKIEFNQEEKENWGERAVITGNPLRESLFETSKKLPIWWPDIITKRPILLIMGGSQGAQAINEALVPILAELSNKYLIVHQVGPSTSHHDYVGEFLQKARDNQVDLNNYYVRDLLSEEELRFIYPKVNLAISRAGANAVAEIVSFEIPCIFIPLPSASLDEQTENANYYVKKRAAYIIPQNELQTENLRQKILQLDKYQLSLREKLHMNKPDMTAASKICTLMRELINLDKD